METATHNTSSIPSFSYTLGFIIAFISMLGMIAVGYEITINKVIGKELMTNCICLFTFLVFFFAGIAVQKEMDK
jgi:low temperature requirement protein LtrA